MRSWGSRRRGGMCPRSIVPSGSKLRLAVLASIGHGTNRPHRAYRAIVGRASEVAMRGGGRAPVFHDRREERAALRTLVADACAGLGRALVVRGEAGVGKTALIDDLVQHT